jgi:hypothetical protein
VGLLPNLSKPAGLNLYNNLSNIPRVAIKETRLQQIENSSKKDISLKPRLRLFNFCTAEGILTKSLEHVSTHNLRLCLILSFTRIFHSRFRIHKCFIEKANIENRSEQTCEDPNSNCTKKY